jgi:RHS repeat-associated protein
MSGYGGMKKFIWPPILMGLAMAAGAHAETIHSVTQVNYDVRNQPVCTAVRMNTAAYGAVPADACTLGTEGTQGPDRITKNTYNAAGQLTEVIRAFNITTANGFPTTLQQSYARYTYTANGLKATEKDANGNLTTLEYDGFDQLKKLRYPSTTAGAGTSSTTDYEEYDYDNNGNRTYTRRRDGQVINDCFDSLNRITIHYVHAQTGCTATGGVGDVYTIYDGLGRIASKRFASFGGSGVSYAYDGLGRVTGATDMNGRTTGYTYNAASARISIIYPDLNTISWVLDNANRLSTIGWNATSGLFTQSYDNLGRVSGEGKLGGSSSYGYDGIGRLASKTNNVANAAHDITWTFAYNPAGQIQSSAASASAFDYRQTTGSAVNSAFDGLNRDSGIVSVGGYDARGNVTYEGTGGRTMTYDVENRLLTVNSSTANVKLEYDPEGRLYRYSADGGSNWTTFLYDGVNLIGEYAGTSAMPMRRYVHGSGTDNPLLWLEGTGTSSVNWYYTNHQGSIVYIADAYGQGNALYRYDPYGVPTDRFNNLTWSGSRFRYTGQTMIPEARLYYYKARVYDPQMGRFLQTDPIGSQDDLNLYAYVRGDPVNGTDPTGTETTCVERENGGRTCTTTEKVPVLVAVVVQPILDVAAAIHNAIVHATEGDSEDDGQATGEAPSNAGDETRTPAPALPGDPYHPSEVDKRRSGLRDDLETGNKDPDSPIPDQQPGSDQGGHGARGRTPHKTGERNVNSKEEHSRRPKGNPEGRRW